MKEKIWGAFNGVVGLVALIGGFFRGDAILMSLGVLCLLAMHIQVDH